MSKKTGNDEEQYKTDDAMTDALSDEEYDEDWDEEEPENVNMDISSDDDNDNVTKDCAYESLYKPKGMIDKTTYDDAMDEYNEETEDNEDNNNGKIISGDDRLITKLMTKYDRAKILANRVSQLKQQAKPMINGVEGLDEEVIAQLELESKMMPYILVKRLPNGDDEEWKVSEMTLKREHIKYGFTGGVVDIDAINKRTNELNGGGNITGIKRL